MMPLPGLKSMDVPQAALRMLAHRGHGDWWVLVAEAAADSETIAAELLAELRDLDAGTVAHVHGPEDTHALVKALTAHPDQPVVVSGLEAWSEEEWQHLDQLRSRLERNERTILVVTSNTFGRIQNCAPNFSSWLGGNVLACHMDGIALTEEERTRRLAALRDWAGLTDDEVIARARAKTLPAEPEFAEWLVLLDRGDLIEP